MTTVPSDDTGAVPWLTVENGVHAWVMKGLELDAKHVQYQRQATSGDPAPKFLPDRFAAIRLTGFTGVGTDWEVVKKPDPTVNAYVHHVRGPRVGVLQVRVYNCDPLGKHSALATLDRLLAVVRMPSARKIIRLGRFGVGHVITPPRNVDLFRDRTLLDPYGLLEVAIHVGSDVAEVGSVISRVKFEIKSGGGDTLVPPTWVPDGPPVGGKAELAVEDIAIVGDGTVS